jgi:hypothetical protein
MQRRSVKEALRATFRGRRGLGYIPPLPSGGSEGVSVRFVPEPVPGAQSTADYPQHVPDPLPAARDGSGGWSGPLLGGRVAHTGCRAAGHTSGRKTWVRFAKGGKGSQCDLQTKLNLRCNPLHEKNWRVRLYPQTFANR